MKNAIACMVLLLTGPVLSAQTKSHSTADMLIGKMTLEEKAALVSGKGMEMPVRNPQPSSPVVGATEDKVPGAAGNTLALPRLGLPSLVLSDGPAGVRIDSVRKGNSSRTYYATAWPVATLLASTWDTTMVKRMGVAFGNEIHDYGIDIILAPAMNIQRNPLGGRNFEYFSEDPVVSGYTAAALVNSIQSVGVGTSIKHFVANNAETNRYTSNSIVSERALREIYLKGFEITVKKSNPWTIMSSYNKINGTYASENHDLLTTVLRKEWGYKGLVMTDWDFIDGKDHVAQMKAGNNLLMPGNQGQTRAIMEAVKNGTIDEKVLDENCERIVQLILKSPAYKNFKFSDNPDLKQHAQLSKTIAEDGMVLLKNNGEALPFNKNTHSIALFGINGYELIAGGTGSGDVNKAYTVSLERGLENAGYKVDADIKNVYSNYLSEENAKHPKKSFIEEIMNPTPPVKEYAAGKDFINREASAGDIAVIAIGRNAGETRDRKVEDDFNLSDTERMLIQDVSDAFHALHKKVVVVLNIAGVIEVASWRDYTDAVLLAWQPGQEGGNAITDLLKGKVNPSGKLAVTFPLKYDDAPSAKTFPGKEYPEQAISRPFGPKLIPTEVTYNEGIYVGYRYYNTFRVPTAYEFGYGLSYTRFSYSNLKLTSSKFNGKLSASFVITNTGKVTGKEIAQLYISAPKGKLDKPAEELKGFAKTGVLQPGQSETIHFNINATDLASFNTESSSWIADAGKYALKIGASSEDIKLQADFAVPWQIIVEKDHKVLRPAVEIPEFTGK